MEKLLLYISRNFEVSIGKHLHKLIAYEDLYAKVEAKPISSRCYMHMCILSGHNKNGSA
jgi:hypothetical protein